MNLTKSKILILQLKNAYHSKKENLGMTIFPIYCVSSNSRFEFLGHVMRKEGLEELMLIGRVNGKRSRGRQRLTYLESLSKWMTEQVDETEKLQVARLKILRTAKDRELWRTMVVNVHGEYDT